VTLASAAVTGIDFGFNFDTTVNVNDSGQGSLRQFIANANALGNGGLAQSGLVAGKDNAVFMISNGTAAAGLRVANNYFAGGVATIAPGTALPTITDSAVLDATNQPGFSAGPIVQLSGTGAGAGVSGLTISAGSSVVRRLIINNFLGSGIALSGAGGNIIQGNYLGTNFDGTSASQNDQQGLFINGSPNNIIGGATAAQRNIISGNRLRGILVSGAGATANNIQGNYIGTNASGNAALPNNLGIFVFDAPANIIGGTAAGEGNVISGNTQIGIQIAGNGSSGNMVQGNIIGLSAAGGAGLPNGTRGIDVVSGAAGNTIGGASAGAGNTIAGNGSEGVRVTTGAANRIQRNSIYGNTGVGINLGVDALTPNDGTLVAGGNNGMDYPVINIAALSGGTLTIAGHVGSAAGEPAFANAVIEIFKADNSPADQNGQVVSGDGLSVAHGEGRTYLGTITANASGNFNTTLAVAGLAIGDAITATATSPGNDTSEFGANIVVTQGGGSVSGFVYEDVNLNVQRDSSETGTGLSLYIKLIDTTNPSGPAVAAASVNPATGAYSITSVATGIYTLVLDDNNTLTDVTPTLTAGWSGTEMPNGTRTPVPINGPMPNQNFGLYHGLLVTGRVFNDNGTGAGTANDGSLNGTEPGVSGAVVKLTDTSGATVYSNATTDATGAFALAIPSSVAAGTQLKITETNPAGFVSTGASVGSTSGSYDRSSDTITFNIVANTSYTNVSLGDVAVNTLSTDGQQAGLPGTTLYYAHTFVANSKGTLSLSTTSVQNPLVAGWTATIYRDSNSNGKIDAGEPAITAPVAVNTGDTVAVIVKVFIPANAPLGAKDQTTLSANFAYTGASPALNASLSRQDKTTVGNPTTSDLTLTKTVDKPAAAPGETITYTVTYTNNSTDVLRDVIIYDSTPAFTTFVSGSNGPLPADLTAVAFSSPAVGGTGAMRWTFTGTLRPGGTSTVTFRVKLDQ
jgi:uncharacterized repeat protein (TIGR01451 family)